MLEKRTIGTDESAENLVRYVYSNHLQSASLELDGIGDIISYEEYHPYGTTAFQAKNASINAVAKRYRYTGKERDEESGLYYHGVRYYIPWLCRWTAIDPLESKYAGLSPYNYGNCNPITFNDPSGNEGEDTQKKYEEGERKTKQMFQSKLDEVANSKADPSFKKWFADLGLEGITSFRDALFQSKVDNWKNSTRQRDWFGRDPNDASKAYLPEQKRISFWSESIAETVPTLKSLWATQQTGSSGDNAFLRNRALTISNKDEGWDLVTEVSKKVASEWILHLSLGGGVRNLNQTRRVVNGLIPEAKKALNIALGKNINLQQFAIKTSSNSMHTFDKVIPGFKAAKDAEQFESFDDAFDYISKAVISSKGKFHFNLEYVNISAAKSIPVGTKLMERLEAYGGRSLWEMNMITEWELSQILNNPTLLKNTYFYKMGMKIPQSLITK